MIMQAPFSSLISAALVGLLGGVHCLGMCGGIVATLTLSLPAQARHGWKTLLPYHLAYNLGRIGGYTLAGALFGALGALLLELDALRIAQRALYGLAGIIMILLGLYLAGWWRALAFIERAGMPLWRRLEPFGRRLLPVRSPLQAVAVGLVWAWLPCGLVYSVLIMAASSADTLTGAGIALAFGLGTLVNLLGIALLAGAAARVAEQPWMRRLAGLLVGVLGIQALWRLSGG